MPKKPKEPKAKKARSAPDRELAEIWLAMKNLETAHAVEKKRILSMSEISLILDNYDDIFSKFDPRPYSERGLSEDFLSEIKKGCKDKSTGQVELTFLVPSTIKDPQRELLIEKRLKNHFQKHYDIVNKDIWAVRRTGGMWVLIGAGLSVIATLLYSHSNVSNNVLDNFAFVLFEPASWFVMWAGFEQIFNTWKKDKGDLDFYKRMTESKISFLPY